MLCKSAGCTEQATGKSKYCTPHKRLARANFMNTIKIATDARTARNENFARIWAEANAAGVLAATEAQVVPMTVQARANPMDSNSPVTQSWHVPDGVCGFAWIKVRPGNSQFANWLKANANAHKDYYGGVSVSIHDYNQSMQRKEAHARAAAEYLRKVLPDLTITADSRLD